MFSKNEITALALAIPSVLGWILEGLLVLSLSFIWSPWAPLETIALILSLICTLISLLTAFMSIFCLLANVRAIRSWIQIICWIANISWMINVYFMLKPH